MLKYPGKSVQLFCVGNSLLTSAMLKYPRKSSQLTFLCLYCFAYTKLHLLADNQNIKKVTKHKSRSSLRQSAKHIISSMSINEQKGIVPTEDQKKSLDWAMNFLKSDSERIQALQSDQASKRDRSFEENAEDAKRHKIENPHKEVVKNIDGIPLSEIVKQHLKVCIVDTSKPDWHISVEGFTLIESHMMKSIRNLIGTGVDPPGYDMSERYHGFRLIECETQFALDFLNKFISELPLLWVGAKIEIKSLKELPAPRKVRILIPELGITKEEILDTLIRSNRKVPIEKWKLVFMGAPANGRRIIIFRTDDESLIPLEATGNKVSYSLRKITAVISKSRSLEKELEEGEQFDKMDVEEPIKELEIIPEEAGSLIESISLEDKDDTLTN